MKRTRLAGERLEPRRVLSAEIGLGLADYLAGAILDPGLPYHVIAGGTALVDVQKLIVAGSPSLSPPDSPAARVDPNTTTSPFAGVGSLQIRSGSSSYICTGTVIGAEYVLTAGHCLDINNNGSIDVTPPDVTFNLNFGGSLTHSIPATELYIHPDFTGFAAPVVNDDVAVIRLSQPVPAGVPIYALNTTPPFAGQTITMAGYGQSGDGVNGYTVSPSFSVKRVGSNRTDDFDPDDEGSGQTEVFIGDFDGGTATNFLGGGTLGNNIETTLGGGDSGGPSFINQGGQLVVYGIDTFTTRFRMNFFFLGPAAPRFGSGFGGIVVQPYVDWIDSIVGDGGGGGDTLPTVDITSPANLASVSGTINVTANASDDVGVTQVDFRRGGASLGVDTNAADGWSVSWDTTTVGDGSYTLEAIATDTAGQTSTDSVLVTVNNVDDPVKLYFAVGTTAAIGGLSVARDDIVAWDGASFSIFFDGSDVGLTDQFGTLTIDALDVISPNEILLSFAEAGGILGFGSFDDSDIVKFTATSLGQNTAGSWSFYFDGSDVGLTQSGEDIDAIELLPDGRLLVSTIDVFSVTGASGQDEDLLAFRPTSLGSVTSGTWSFYFDGSDVGLTATSEDIDGSAVGPAGEIYLSTIGDFAVPGVSGANEDVFVFRPILTGTTTLGSYDAALFFDGSAVGLGALDLKAIDVPSAGAAAAVRGNVPRQGNRAILAQMLQASAARDIALAELVSELGSQPTDPGPLAVNVVHQSDPPPALRALAVLGADLQGAGRTGALEQAAGAVRQAELADRLFAELANSDDGSLQTVLWRLLD